MSFTCDWPKGRGVCGAPAVAYVNQGPTHRPICRACQDLVPTPYTWGAIEQIDPTRVPGPTFVHPREPDAPPDPIPLNVENPNLGVSAEPQTSRPPLGEAFADLALAAMRWAQRKLEGASK